MERILKKVKGLLELSNSPNENEAANAMAKAMALLRKHNLELSEAESFNEDDVIIEDGDKSTARNTVPAWEQWLISELGELFACRILLSKSFELNSRGNFLLKNISILLDTKAMSKSASIFMSIFAEQYAKCRTGTLRTRDSSADTISASIATHTCADLL